MYYFHTVCCICLSNNGEVKQMFRSEGGRDYFTKLTSCIPEMHFKEMDNMKVMCKECCDTVDMMYNYREKCLRSKRILISCTSQLGSLDNANGELSVFLTNIAHIKEEKCSETEYETTTGITDKNIPLPDQATVPNDYEERKMLLAYDNEYRCDSDLSNKIKTENIDLHFSDTELGDTGSDEIPLHDPLAEDELTANEIKVEKTENIDLDLNDTELGVFSSDEIPSHDTLVVNEIKVEKPDNIDFQFSEYQYSQGLAGNEIKVEKPEDIDLHFSDTELVDTGSDEIPLHDPLSHEELAANEIKVEIDIEEHPLSELEGDIDVFKSFLKCEKPDNQINNDDVSVQGTSVGTESSNKESNASEANFLKGLTVKKYECYTCNMKFARKSKLEGHVKKHCEQTGDEQYDKFTRERNSPHEYNICNKKFTYSDEKPHKCEICSKKFSTKRSMLVHMKNHTGEKPYKCEICAKSFSEKRNMSRHMLTHTGEKPHKCKICAKSFSEMYDMSVHMKTHTGEKPHKCEICVKKFATKKSMSVHMKTHTGVKPHKCEICAKTFSEKHHFSRHMMTHTGEKPHKCEICAKSFITKYAMSLHMMTHTGEKPHKCEICAREFLTKGNMSLHMMTHTGEKPHKCELCTKQFYTKRDMSVHMMSHTGEKPHKCEICTKQFCTKRDISLHMMTHTGEKPHECNICYKKFTRKIYLSNHMSTHTGEKLHNVKYASNNSVQSEICLST